MIPRPRQTRHDVRPRTQGLAGKTPAGRHFARRRLARQREQHGLPPAATHPRRAPRAPAPGLGQALPRSRPPRNLEGETRLQATAHRLGRRVQCRRPRLKRRLRAGTVPLAPARGHAPPRGRRDARGAADPARAGVPWSPGPERTTAPLSIPRAPSRLSASSLCSGTAFAASLMIPSADRRRERPERRPHRPGFRTRRGSLPRGAAAIPEGHPLAAIRDGASQAVDGGDDARPVRPGDTPQRPGRAFPDPYRGADAEPGPSPAPDRWNRGAGRWQRRDRRNLRDRARRRGG